MAIPYRSKISSTTFRKLPFGAIYYLSATDGPYVKIRRRHRLETNVIPQNDPAQTAVTDTSVNVIRSSKFVLGAQKAIP